MFLTMPETSFNNSPPLQASFTDAPCTEICKRTQCLGKCQLGADKLLELIIFDLVVV